MWPISHRFIWDINWGLPKSRTSVLKYLVDLLNKIREEHVLSALIIVEWKDVYTNFSTISGGKKGHLWFALRKQNIIKNNFLLSEGPIYLKIFLSFFRRILASHYNSLQQLKGKTGYRMEFVYGKAFYRAVNSAAWIEELSVWVGI